MQNTQFKDIQGPYSNHNFVNNGSLPLKKSNSNLKINNKHSDKKVVKLQGGSVKDYS